MPQTSDIVLDGTPYMLVPGSYRRSSAGLPEGRTGRVVISDFVGGQRRAIQLERDTSWDSPGVGPALFGQGVEPWPYGVAHTDAAVIPVSSSQRVHTLTLGNAVYLGIGRYVYRTVALTAGSWSDLTQVADIGAGQTVSGLAYYGGYLAIGCGNGADVRLLDPGSLALTTLSAGLKGGWIAGYAGHLVLSDPIPGNEAILRLTTGGGLDTRELDSPITNMALHGGKVAIATRAALWLLGGRGDAVNGVWMGEPEPVYTQYAPAADDFRFLCSFGGKLYTWLAGSAVEWNPNAGASKQGWRATGLDGRACFGGTVAGNMLVVSVQSHTGSFQLWAFDGTGWWLMRETDTVPWVWPVALAGAGSFDLLGFRNGDTGVTYDLVRMTARGPSAPAYAASGRFTTSLLDAGERDAPKSWHAVGATFAAPETRGNPASTDPVTLSLDWSIDAGETWTSAASLVASDPTQRAFELSAELPVNVAVAPFLQMRVGFASVSDWAPVLTGVWADYAVLDAPPRRRRWTLSVIARDGSVQRDGSVGMLDGHAQSAALWQSWEDNRSLSFRDLDYDANPTERQVRVIAIEESVPKPSDARMWGTSIVQLQVQEL
jgi:hypothetical protein